MGKLYGISYNLTTPSKFDNEGHLQFSFYWKGLVG